MILLNTLRLCGSCPNPRLLCILYVRSNFLNQPNFWERLVSAWWMPKDRLSYHDWRPLNWQRKASCSVTFGERFHSQKLWISGVIIVVIWVTGCRLEVQFQAAFTFNMRNNNNGSCRAGNTYLVANCTSHSDNVTALFFRLRQDDCDCFQEIQTSLRVLETLCKYVRGPETIRKLLPGSCWCVIRASLHSRHSETWRGERFKTRWEAKNVS